ncbi:FlgB family protein [Sinirhodobacter populi]|uniref:FlgB family protein n=1 Tax=Paenirhodobacter populi TaxID=2306993 RepID=A0A443K6C5_9RHOB|nr:FlgB family protein [Sinirhodobacter populi]RWR28233.1 FlgB family protein [Sinirhodobacter populi]
MFENLEILRTAQAMATHATQRQNLIAHNVANANTPDFRAKDLTDFAETYRQASGEGMRATRAGHIGAGDAVLRAGSIEDTAEPAPNGNNVSLENELVKSVDVKREHDLALTIYRTSLGILRSSIGKG